MEFVVSLLYIGFILAGPVIVIIHTIKRERAVAQRRKKLANAARDAIDSRTSIRYLQERATRRKMEARRGKNNPANKGQPTCHGCCAGRQIEEERKE